MNLNKPPMDALIKSKLRNQFAKAIKNNSLDDIKEFIKDLEGEHFTCRGYNPTQALNFKCMITLFDNYLDTVNAWGDIVAIEIRSGNYSKYYQTKIYEMFNDFITNKHLCKIFKVNTVDAERMLREKSYSKLLENKKIFVNALINNSQTVFRSILKQELTTFPEFKDNFLKLVSEVIADYNKDNFLKEYGVVNHSKTKTISKLHLTFLELLNLKIFTKEEVDKICFLDFKLNLLSFCSFYTFELYIKYVLRILGGTTHKLDNLEIKKYLRQISKVAKNSNISFSRTDNYILNRVLQEIKLINKYNKTLSDIFILVVKRTNINNPNEQYKLRKIFYACIKTNITNKLLKECIKQGLCDNEETIIDLANSTVAYNNILAFKMLLKYISISELEKDKHAIAKAFKSFASKLIPCNRPHYNPVRFIKEFKYYVWCKENKIRYGSRLDTTQKHFRKIQLGY